MPDNTAPRWSPNGSQIAFQPHRDENWEIYVIDVDGTAPHNIMSSHSAAYAQIRILDNH